MVNKEREAGLEILADRFGRDSLLALATLEGDRPAVRTVNGYYEEGAFYVITYACSNKMRQIAVNPQIAICGEWFTAHGIGENRGYVRAPENMALLEKLRKVFAAWYDNGHTDENDPNTCILRIRLTDGVLLNQGKRYELIFAWEETKAPRF